MKRKENAERHSTKGSITMKKLSLKEMVTLSVGLTARIEQLERFYANTMSDYLKGGYRQEIEYTKKLLDIIDNNDIYTE